MNNREKAFKVEQEVQDQILQFGEEEQIDVEGLKEMSNEEIYQIIKGIDSISSNLRKAKKVLGDALSGNLYNSAKRIGDDIIVGKPKFTWKPYDKKKVIDYLGDDWELVVNPTFRITGIKAVAQRRGQDPWVILESLFEQVETPGVNILPAYKAPKYMQELDDGEVIDLSKKDEGDTDE